MPDKVDEVEKMQEELHDMREQAKITLENARIRAETLLSNINNSRTDVRARIDKLDALIQEENARTMQLERLNASLSAKLEKLTSSVADAKAQMEDLTRSITNLAADIERTEEAKKKVEILSEELAETVEGQYSELHSLEGDLESIAKVEKTINDYLVDYETKIT